MSVLLRPLLGSIPAPEGHALNVRTEMVCPIQEGIANWQVNASFICSWIDWDKHNSRCIELEIIL